MQTKFLKLFLLLIISSTFANAQSIFMEANGTSQGKFEGEVTQKGREKTSQVANYEFLTGSAATAKGVGISNKVLVITKEFDLMSLNFYKALVTNESISKVTLNVYFQNRMGGIAGGAGMEVLSLKIELTDVLVSSYKQTGKPEATTGINKPLDEIKLMYGSLKITHVNKAFVVESK
jgi:type VI secretion system Hcp family effector